MRNCLANHYHFIQTTFSNLLRTTQKHLSPLKYSSFPLSTSNSTYTTLIQLSQMTKHKKPSHLQGHRDLNSSDRNTFEAEAQNSQDEMTDETQKVTSSEIKTKAANPWLSLSLPDYYANEQEPVQGIQARRRTRGSKDSSYEEKNIKVDQVGLETDPTTKDIPSKVNQQSRKRTLTSRQKMPREKHEIVVEEDEDEKNIHSMQKETLVKKPRQIGVTEARRARKMGERFVMGVAPPHWKQIWDDIEEMRAPGGVAGDAPVDTMGYVFGFS